MSVNEPNSVRQIAHASHALRNSGIGGPMSFLTKLRGMQVGDDGLYHPFRDGYNRLAKDGVTHTVPVSDMNGLVRQMLEIPGSYSGRDGVFQFI